METQFATIDPPRSSAPVEYKPHVVLVGEAGSNADLLADALRRDCSIELANSDADVECVLAAPSLVSIAIVDTTSATDDVRGLVDRLREHDIPVLLLVTRATPALRNYVATRHAFDVLEKPIRRAELRTGVARLARD